MATIGQYLSLITNAVYGEEVRSAIVNAIQQCYTDATDVVKVSETEPTSENTRIWIKPTTDECKVPTWEEHEALDGEVSDLKSALESETGVKQATFISGYYKTGGVGTVVTYNEYDSIVCAIMPCNPTDVVTVTITGADAARAIAFVDSEYKLISKSAVNAELVDYQSTAPEGTAYVVFNNRISASGSTPYRASGYYARIGEYPVVAIDKTVKYKKRLYSTDDINTIMTPGMFAVTAATGDTWKPANWPLSGGGNFIVFGRNNADTLRKTQVIFTQEEMMYRVGLGSGNWDSWQYLRQFDGEGLLKKNEVQAKGTNDIVKTLAERIMILEQETGNDTIPDYYESHIESKISDINALRPATGDQFIFITDTHMYGHLSQYGGNPKHSHALINKICKKTLVSKVFNGGDILSPNASADVIRNIDEMRLGIRYTQTDTLAKNYFIAGNHDLGASGSVAASLTAKQLTRLSNLYSPAECDIVYDDNNQFQYYFDDHDKGLRFIVLCMGMTQRSGMSGHTWWDSDAVAWTTCVDFYLDALESTPSGYHIIVFNHMSGIPTSNTTDGFESITALNAVNCLHKPFVAYQQKTTWEYEGKSRDFSGAVGVPACMVFGHSHRDITGVSSDVLENGVSIGGTIPLFVTTTDNPWETVGDGNNNRTGGSAEEQAFDVFTVNKATRKIYVTRIGGGGGDRTNSGNGYSY